VRTSRWWSGSQAINNGALTLLRNVAVTGYSTGIVANEHTDGDAVSLYGNLKGIVFENANHASRFGRLGACVVALCSCVVSPRFFFLVTLLGACGHQCWKAGRGGEGRGTSVC
jgi:hypothetical protein